MRELDPAFNPLGKGMKPYWEGAQKQYKHLNCLYNVGVLVCHTHTFLGPKLPISHQVNLVGEVHGIGQPDQQINAETVATLWNDRLAWNPNEQRTRP